MTAAATLQQHCCHQHHHDKVLPARKSVHYKHALRSPRPKLLRETSDSSTDSTVSVATSKKHVRFAATAPATALHPSTEEDALNSWYSDAEYEAFQNDCRRTVAAFTLAKARKDLGEPKHCLDGSRFTARGLEDVLTQANTEQRDYRKRLHAHHVLKQQYLQRCEGVTCPEWLQAVSARYSKASLDCALERGRRMNY